MNTYIEKENTYLHIAFAFLILILFKIKYFILYLALMTLYYFIYRKNKIGKNLKAIDVGENTLLAPITGRVVGLKENINHKFFGDGLTEVQILIPYFTEIGLRMPYKTAIREVKSKKQKSHFRFKSNLEGEVQPLENVEKSEFGGSMLRLKDDRGHNVGIQILKCRLGLSPRLWVIGGDRGNQGAIIGTLPLGGTVLLYFGHDFDLHIKKGDVLNSMETPIASLT